MATSTKKSPAKQTQKTTVAQEKAPFNGLAIAGFICSFFFAVVGLILSIVGLSQINKDNERGKGLAIAGIVISGVSMFVGVIIAIAMVVFGFAIADKALDNVDWNSDYDYYYEYNDDDYYRPHLYE
jgi:hypothetical protein